MSVKAVLLDWRGTLAMQPSEQQWIVNGLRAAGQPASPSAVDEIISALTSVLRTNRPKEWDQQDTAAGLHRDVHLDLFDRAGLDRELAAELYRLLSDAQQDVMAEDAPEALARLAGLCDAVVIVSDIHVDLRPWFAAHDLAGYITAYALSHEHGVQKPDLRSSAGRSMLPLPHPRKHSWWAIERPMTEALSPSG